MISQELLTSIKALSLTERLALMQLLIISIQSDLDAAEPRNATLNDVMGMLKSDRPVPDLQQELRQKFVQRDIAWGLTGED